MTYKSEKYYKLNLESNQTTNYKYTVRNNTIDYGYFHKER